jgi:hypothetical protein
MPYTINQLASAIDNNVRTGLKGVTNYSYSMEQLEAEVVIERVRILATRAKQPVFRIDGFTQEINEVPVNIAPLAKTKITIPGAISRLHFRIPALVNVLQEDAIEYIGPVKREGMGWRVYFGADHVLHKHRPATGKRPYIYIDPVVGEDGFVDGWLLNITGTVTQIAISAVFANPEDILSFGLQNEQDVYLPVPEDVAEEIIRRLSNKYLQYYRQYQAQIQINDQTDKS